MSHELLHLNSPLILVLLHLVSSLPTCCNLPNSSRFHLSPWRCNSLQQDSGAAWSSHSSKCSHQHGFLLSSWLGKGSASDMKVCISSVALFLAAKSAPKGNSSTLLHAVFFSADSCCHFFHQFHTFSVWNCIIDNYNYTVIIEFVLITLS